MRTTTILQKPRRGTIYDREHHPLAVSVFSGTVSFDPTLFAKEKDPKQSAKNEKILQTATDRVAELVALPVDTVRQVVQAARQNAAKGSIRRYYLVKKDVALDAAKVIRANKAEFIGFGVQDGSKRQYSSSSCTSQVIGMLGEKDIPQSGLERGCQAWLAGKPGDAVAEVGRGNQVFPETIKRNHMVVDGFDVHLSLDPFIQHLAMEQAERIYNDYHPVGGVSIVVEDPNTGDILAMVSMPTLDPNPEERKKLTLEQNDSRLGERCASVYYEPGSTLKGLTVAAALETGAVNMSSRFSCSTRLSTMRRRSSAAARSAGMLLCSAVTASSTASLIFFCSASNSSPLCATASSL